MQANVGSAGRGGLWRSGIDPDRCQCVDHSARSEKVFDSEAVISCARRNHGHDCALGERGLKLKNPTRGRRSITGGSTKYRTGERRNNGAGRKRIAPHENVRAVGDRCRAAMAEIEAHLVAGLAHAVIHSLRVQTVMVRIVLKLELDCPPDAAWKAIRSPSVFRAVSSPLIRFISLEPGGFPEQWSEGGHRVKAKVLGFVPMGSQVISASESHRNDGVRVMRDNGPPLTGALAVIRSWQHSMAISAAPEGRTLFRDELVFSAGIANVPVWIAMWAFWQWRAFRIRALAPSWR